MMKHHTQLLLLILAGLLVVPAHLQHCDLPDSQTLLQSGSKIISNLQSSIKTRYSYYFTVNFPIPSKGLQVAASAFAYYSTRSGVGFLIFGERGTKTTGVITVVMSQPNKWTKITVSYLASGRADFNIGEFVSSLRQRPQGRQNFNFQLPGTVFKDTRVAVVLNGVFTDAETYNVAILKVNAYTSGRVILNLNITANAATKFYVTFIHFSEFAPFHDAEYSPGNTIKDIKYRFVGLKGKETGYGTYLGHQFRPKYYGLTCNSYLCPSSCISYPNCENKNGRIQSQKCIL